MHIVIRSSKHDSSTTYTLGRDFDKLLILKEFETVVKKDGQIKPLPLLMGELTQIHVFQRIWMFPLIILSEYFLFIFFTWCFKSTFSHVDACYF